MTSFDLLVVLLLSVLTAATLYLWFLAAFGIVRNRRRPAAAVWRFCIIVPAHNEEAGIADTLSCLRGLRRSRRSEAVVIADNCDDRTADVASGFDVEVLERQGPRRGKGYALEWAMERLPLERFDAVVIVDADTRVAPDMLEALSRSLALGYGAVQLENRLEPSRDSGLSHLQAIANATENRLYYQGRAAVGLPVLLRGTGMAVSVDVLRRHPWASHSITEDVDFAVGLLIAGVAIDFSLESHVESAATLSYRQAAAQKERWAAGTFRLIRDRFLPLLKIGFRQQRLGLIELAFSLLLLSRPALIYSGLVALIAALFTTPGLRMALFSWALAVILALVGYVLAGWFFVRDKWGALKGLLQVPVFAVWFVMVQIRALVGHRRGKWVRTGREE